MSKQNLLVEGGIPWRATHLIALLT